jgi:mannan endo-1,4-beta-mannosidase
MRHISKLGNLRFAFPLLLAVVLAAIPSRLKAQAVRFEAEDAQLIGPNLRIVRPGVQPAAAKVGAAEDRKLPPSGPRPTGYSGNGYVSGLGDAANRIVMHYIAPKAGIYDVRIGYRCPNKCAYEMQVNELGISGTFSPQTPGFFEVQQAGKAELQAGDNTLVLSQGWGGYDVDYLELSTSGPIVPPVRPVSAPSDPHITPEARALLQAIDDRYGRGTMMGVYSEADAQYVLNTTGFLPAILGADLSSYSPASIERQAHPSEIVERMIAQAHQGYILTFSWHWVPPFGLLNRMIAEKDGTPPIDARWNRGFYTNATNFDVSIAMRDPQSMERQLLLRDIDAIAVQLRKLQDAHVPILWRPLHEAQGGWFWWGARGPQPFIQLWQLLYDRLVNVDGIHNLIWVYTSADDPSWYPGDAYVDVVGVDGYPKDLSDPQSELWERLNAQFAGKKPLTLSEFGGVPDIARMRRLGVDWSYAVSWNGSEGPKKNSPESLQQTYADQWALKRTVSSTSLLSTP